jgi:hypothetical protein
MSICVVGCSEPLAQKNYSATSLNAASAEADMLDALRPNSGSATNRKENLDPALNKYQLVNLNLFSNSFY